MQTKRPILVFALLVAGCQREEVTHFRIAKAAALAPMQAVAAAPIPAAAPSGEMVQTAGMAPAKPTVALAWTLPEGWTQGDGGGMRYATLKPPGGVDVSVVVLPGIAGGELANINRWRGQLGIGPLDEAAAKTARSLVQTKPGPFALYDFQGGGQKPSRMIAARAVVGGNTWFFKMLGEPRDVGAARPGFIKLLESLHVD